MIKILTKPATIVLLGSIFIANASYGASKEESAGISKWVSVCTAYAIGSETKLECDGVAKGERTLKEMYKNGWVLEESVSGGNKFILIFTN